MPLSFLKQLALEQHRRHVTVPRAARLLAALRPHVASAGSLLDVGAGDGAIAKALADQAGATRVAGVDVLLRPHREIDVVEYDGLTIPFPDRSFDVVTIVDVLHHCTEPLTVLREALRVAAQRIVIKDHLAFGPISRRVLHWMDRVGNSAAGVASPGTYFSLDEWIAMVSNASGRIAALDWPIAVHSLPVRALVRSELHFTATVVPL